MAVPPTSTRLKSEISLNRAFVSLSEEVLLAWVLTQQGLEKLGDRLFSAYGFSSAQFNTLMILWDYRRRPIMLSDLSRMLLVNAASAGALVDRMVRQGLVERRRDPRDGRAVRLTLTEQGVRTLEKVKTPYYRLLPKVFAGVKSSEKRLLLGLLERMRDGLASLEERSR